MRRLTALQKVSNGDGQVVLHIRQNMGIGVLRRLLAYIHGLRKPYETKRIPVTHGVAREKGSRSPI